MTIDRESFSAAMRYLASGVCVITTTAQDGKRCGLTATAVCSVSANPPTLLACVNSAAGTYAAITAAQHFAVNLLSVEDREVARRFAGRIPPDERFRKGSWGTLATGAPVLESALAAFDCRLSQVIGVATHGILLGDIQAVRFREPHAKPLLYVHGAYAGVTSIEAVKGSLPNHLTSLLSSDPRFLEDGLHWGLL